jgi:hypothetical protein
MHSLLRATVMVLDCTLLVQREYDSRLAGSAAITERSTSVEGKGPVDRKVMGWNASESAVVGFSLWDNSS